MSFIVDLSDWKHDEYHGTVIDVAHPLIKYIIVILRSAIVVTR